MATIDDLLNAQAYRRAALAEGLAMGKDTKQPGGIPNRPYDAPKEDPNNPYVPAPKRNSLMIANEGPSSPVKIHEGVSIEDGKPYKRVLPNYGGAGINYETIRYKPGFGPKDLVHHTGGKHFTEPTIDDLIKGIINGDIPKGTLGPEEDRMIEEYKKRNTNQSMLISGAQDINTKMNPLQDGSFLDEDGNRYLWSPREQKFLDMGPYDPDVHGLPIPLANKNKMTIA